MKECDLVRCVNLARIVCYTSVNTLSIRPRPCLSKALIGLCMAPSSQPDSYSGHHSYRTLLCNIKQKRQVFALLARRVMVMVYFDGQTYCFGHARIWLWESTNQERVDLASVELLPDESVRINTQKQAEGVTSRLARCSWQTTTCARSCSTPRIRLRVSTHLDLVRRHEHRKKQ